MIITKNLVLTLQIDTDYRIKFTSLKAKYPQPGGRHEYESKPENVGRL